MTAPAPPPPAQLMQLLSGKFVANAVSMAAKLKVADQLHDGPRTAEDVARGIDANPEATYRLLRALAMVGVLTEEDGRRFALTPVGECLRSDVPGSLAGMAIFMGEAFHSAAWAEGAYSVKTGQPAFAHVHGAPPFAWLAAHPREGAVMNEAMTAFSVPTARAVVAAYDFTKLATIVDVGGGHGSLITEILARAVESRGILFDQPAVVDGAAHALAEAGIADRCARVGGDFMADVPAGGDAYVLKHVLHDWDDARCVTILTNVAKRLTAGARVLVVEHVLPPPGVPNFGKLLDLEMLVMTGGKERTREEFAALFASAGLELVRVVETPSPVSILEAVPSARRIIEGESS